MPCTYTGSIEGDRILSLSQELDKVTRLLCEVMTNFGPLITEEANHANVDLSELEEWWERHQDLDAKKSKLDKLTRMTVQARSKTDRRKKKKKR